MKAARGHIKAHDEHNIEANKGSDGGLPPFTPCGAAVPDLVALHLYACAECLMVKAEDANQHVPNSAWTA